MQTTVTTTVRTEWELDNDETGPVVRRSDGYPAFEVRRAYVETIVSDNGETTEQTNLSGPRINKDGSRNGQNIWDGLSGIQVESVR